MQITDLSLRDVDLVRFCEARNQAQNVAQWLARMASSFSDFGGPPNPGGLFWIDGAQSITTPEIAPDTTLEMRLPELWMQFSEGGRLVPHRFEVEEKSSAEIEAWLRVEMLHRNFDREKFSTALPYHWSKLMTGDEKKYAPESLATELQLLTDYFRGASIILASVRDRLRASLNGDQNPLDAPANGGAAEPLECSPEGFDISFSIGAARKSGEGPGAIRVAFTTGDDGEVAPRFFISPNSAAEKQRSAEIAVLLANNTNKTAITADYIIDNLVSVAKKHI